MKLQILSDLHIDSYAKKNKLIGNIPSTEADMILVAGDTANSKAGMLWLQEQANRNSKPILTVAGNHEYFDEDILTFDTVLAKWDNFNKVAFTGLKIMQCSTIDIDNYRFLGCTLWTDYQFEKSVETIPMALEFMRDYKRILAGNELFTPEMSVLIHYKHRAWLEAALIQAEADGKKAIVMTHHSISAKSVSQKYAGMPSNAAFVSDLSQWMHQSWAPTLWVHGHTHEAFDYVIGSTRVVVNPRAYPGEVSSTKLVFDWSKVVEV